MTKEIVIILKFNHKHTKGCPVVKRTIIYKGDVLYKDEQPVGMDDTSPLRRFELFLIELLEKRKCCYNRGTNRCDFINSIKVIWRKFFG